jgi:hypothetical protein
VSTVAVVLAAGTGGAYAATMIDGHSIKNGSVPAKKLTSRARASLKGQRGPQGPPAGGINFLRTGPASGWATPWVTVYNDHGYKLEARCQTGSTVFGMDVRATTPNRAGIDWSAIRRYGAESGPPHVIADGIANSGGPTTLDGLSLGETVNNVRNQGQLSLHSAGGVLDVDFIEFIDRGQLCALWGTAVFSPRKAT